MMRTTTILAILILALAQMVCPAKVSQAAPMGTAFTYQGRLMDANGPADGLYDFEFSLYDAVEDGNQLDGTVDINDLDVIDGYFTVLLDFGNSVFNGDARWLQIGVRPSELEDSSEYATLSPRQELTPAPYAMYAETARAARSLDAADGSPTDALYVDDAGNIGIGTITPGAKLDVEVTSGGAATIGSSYNSATGDYAVAMGDGTTASGNNSTAMGVYTTAGGYASTAMGYYTTAGGWASTAMGRQTTADGYASTAMGEYTTASGMYSTAMGNDTTASESFSIAMGYGTTASGFCSTAMGSRTTASVDYSTALGFYTTASGSCSTAIGREIEAAGQYSVAIALADMDGATVTQDNTMAILGGNVGIGTTSPAAMLDVNGEIKITDGSQGAGKVLTSDAGGLASWQTPAAGDSDWIISGIDVYSGVSGNVGIGTKSPTAKLDVVSSSDYCLRSEASNTGDVENYGGYFTAAGKRGRAIYGEASDATWYNYGGYFIASGRCGQGVYGYATGSDGRGVSGEAAGQYGQGIRGYATGSDGQAVYGSASNPGENVENYGGYFSAAGNYGIGVYGWASNSGTGTNYGGYFKAEGKYGRGIYAEGGPSGYAAEFMGNVIIKNRDGTTTLMQLGEGFDYAEGFDVSDKSKVSPGTVLIIDAENPGKLAVSRKAYDSKVAGIVAGAKGQGSGVRLGAGQFDQDVALAGRVYCNVDATETAVEPGDLLTTSGKPGYAMKAGDYMRAQGAILGKAMEKLEKGQKTQILVLVTLQ
jgi:hypothetical protein